MKYLSLITIGIIVYSCSTKPEPTFKEKVDSALTDYYQNLPDLGANGKVDSINVILIDSLSKKAAYQYKLNYYVREYSKQEKIWKNRDDIYKLGKNLYDADLQRMNKEAADEELVKLNALFDLYNKTLENMSNMDSTSYEYYLPTFKIFGKENGSHMEIETQAILTKSLVFVKPENL